jgi:hypothetical protein
MEGDAVKSGSGKMAAWPDESYRRFSVDIHVPDWDPALLSDFDAAQYVDCMARAGVQALIHYAKSHVGLCLWRTELSRMHGAMGERDFFGEVVAECRKRSIHPLAYFSLIYDNWIFETNPDWRVVRSNGKVDDSRYGLVCPNSAYPEYVFACIREIAGRYDIDGVFFDMTFWPGVCYCRHCEARFRREQDLPLPHVVNWDDPAWRAFQRSREAWMLEFAKSCTRVVKETRPGITVNHQYSTALHSWQLGVPLELTEACDYVGGDFYGGPAQHSLACKLFNSVTRSRPFEFHTSRTRILTDHVTVKPIPELCTEAFVATLHSAALWFVDYINADGTLNPDAYDFLGGVSARRAAYEPYLGGQLLADVAIYFDKNSLYNPNEQGVEVHELKAADQCPHRDAVAGAARILQAAHIPFGVVTNATLGQLGRYRAVIVPNVLEMTAEQAELFRKFVAAGGVLLASGPSSLDRMAEGGPRFLLEDVLGVRYAGVEGTKITYVTPRDRKLLKTVWPQDHVSHAGPMVIAEALAGTETLAFVTLPFVEPEVGKNIGSRFTAIHSDPPALAPLTAPGVTVRKFRKGWAVWMAAPFEMRDEKVNHDMLVHLLRRVLHGPFRFEVDTHPAVEMTLFHQPERKRMRAGLLNLQRQLPQIPVGAKVRVLLPEERLAKRVLLLPENVPVPFVQEGDFARFEVAPFDTLAMLAIDYE